MLLADIPPAAFVVALLRHGAAERQASWESAAKLVWTDYGRLNFLLNRPRSLGRYLQRNSEVSRIVSASWSWILLPGWVTNSCGDHGPRRRDLGWIPGSARKEEAEVCQKKANKSCFLDTRIPTSFPSFFGWLVGADDLRFIVMFLGPFRMAWPARKTKREVWRRRKWW